MANPEEVLSDESLILLFSYAPVGFGHLRVTDALYHGLPKNSNPLLLETHDRSLTFLHRISSIHPWARSIMERIQRGRAESIVTFFYRHFLHQQTKLIYQQIATIIEQRIVLPRRLLIVSTHFGLAHQIAAVKKKIEEEKKIKVHLVVQVTDDSPQKIWYVPGSDLIFVPSEYTKRRLSEYGNSENLAPVPIHVLPYPISPSLAKTLTTHQYDNRLHQTHAESTASIHMSIPISGAAVGLSDFTKIIDDLFMKSQRFKFFVVTKSALHTQNFINEMLKRTYVQLIASSFDKGVVEQYEQLYLNHTIALEITKPSEQAFKALIDPTSVGGSILLLSRPVGRQEYDNINFLSRHNLIPHKSVQEMLWKKARNKETLGDHAHDIWNIAVNWRGVRLPNNSSEVADFIWWCMNQSIFSAMMQKKISKISEGKEHFEVHGMESTKLFWERVAHLVEEI